MSYDEQKLKYTGRSVADYFGMSYGAFRKMAQNAGLSGSSRDRGDGYTQEELEILEDYRATKSERSIVAQRNAQLLDDLRCAVKTKKYPISVVAEYLNADPNTLANCIRSKCKDLPRRTHQDPGYTFDEVAIIEHQYAVYAQEKVHNLKIGGQIKLKKFNNLPVLFILNQGDISISTAFERLGFDEQSFYPKYVYFKKFDENPKYSLIVNNNICTMSCFNPDKPDQDLDFKKFKRSYACYLVRLLEDNSIVLEKFLGDIKKSTYLSEAKLSATI